MNNLNSDEFERMIGQSSLTLIEFWSNSCFSCKDAESFLLKLEQAYMHKCSLAKVNIDQERLMIERFSISLLPTFILFKESAEIARVTGFRKKEDEIEKAIRKNL